MNRLDKLNRAQLMQVAMYLMGPEPCALAFDPFTDEQLRLFITNKAINRALEAALDDLDDECPELPTV